MKVIYLMAPGPFGGAERVVAAGVTELAKRGVDIEIWLIQETRFPELADRLLGEIPGNIKRRLFQTESALSWGLMSELDQALAELPVKSVLHTHGFKAAVYGHLTSSKNIKHIHTHHGNTSHTLKVKFYEALEQWVMKRVDEVHAVSRPMQQQLIQHGVKKLTLVKNPLTIATLPRRNHAKVKTMLFVGRLSPEKGTEVLLQALAQLPKDLCRCVIVGDGPEREKLKAQATAQVEFVGFQRDIGPYLMMADALVMPSYREGLPLTLIEAVASGLPVIASAVGGIPDLVTHEKNGLLVSPGKADLLAQAIQKFCQDSQHFSESAQALAPAVRNEYAIENWGQVTLARYRSIIQA